MGGRLCLSGVTPVSTQNITQHITQPAFRTLERGADQGQRYLRVTIVWHTDLLRIGHYADLHEWQTFCRDAHSGPIPIGRNQPEFSDGRAINDLFVSRQALTITSLQTASMPLEHVLRIDANEHSDVRLGPSQGQSLLLTEAELLRGQPIRLGQSVVLYLRLVDLAPTSSIGVSLLEQRLVGASPEMLRLRSQVYHAACSDLPVMLLGESGSGKEIIAAAIHQLSARAEHPFIAINMAAIPETLVAAELFGVVKGAFTGAEARSGVFTKADRGVLFLDEVGDTPQAHQIQLLRALEQGQIQPVGGDYRTVNVRTVAATDGSVEAEDGFRRALRHRLSGYTIEIPPLRQRPEDIGPQVMFFLSEKIPGTVTAAPEDGAERPEVAAHWARFFYQALLSDWSGNSRELRHAALRHVMGEQELLPVTPAARSVKQNGKMKLERTLNDSDIAAVFADCDYEVARAAEVLGLSRQSLYRRLQKLPGFVAADSLSEDEIRSALQNQPSLPEAARSLKVSMHALRPRLRQLGVR